MLQPNTAYTATLTVTDAFMLVATQALAFTTASNYSTPTVTITANPAATNAISPWVYGINFYQSNLTPPRNLTLNRTGGNRWTAYNWENNASNAGSDYGPYSNDDYLGGGDAPGEAVRSIIAGDRARGQASLATVPMQGYVAADKNGLVNIAAPNYLANRIKQAVYQKGSAFTASPATNDAYVYMDEFLWALRGKFSGDIYADPTLPTFVSLDNEPDLWSSAHLEIQRTNIAPETFIQKTIALSRALKSVDPAVKIFGPVNYGFEGIVNLQGFPGFTDTYWFVDKHLQELKAASDAAGQRLVDVYDFHWYSAAKSADGYEVGSLTGANLTSDQVQAIVQSPRSLWDTNFVENSWITGYLGGAPVCILGRLQAKIDASWPGTKLAITEYDNGGGNHIAGTIAQADNLGIYGSLGVFAATHWPLSLQVPPLYHRRFQNVPGLRR